MGSTRARLWFVFLLPGNFLLAWLRLHILRDSENFLIDKHMDELSCFYFPTHFSPMSNLKKHSRRDWICYRSKNFLFTRVWKLLERRFFLTFNFIFCASPCEESSAILRDFHPSKNLRACHGSSELRSRVKFVDSMRALAPTQKKTGQINSQQRTNRDGDVVALRDERSPELEREWINKTILRDSQPAKTLT